MTQGARPEGEHDLNKLMIDGIRGVLGMAPLYSGDPVGTDKERYGETRAGWWRQDGRTRIGYGP